jgi:tetratricopeptide (TPR) repeat protein
MVELNARARDHLKLRTPDLQLKDATTSEAMQAEFTDYLATLIRDNKLDRLVVAIDALDELPEPERTTPTITDLLPPADKLPKGCTIVLTSRESVRPRTAADLDRLRRAGPEGFTELPLRPDARDNRELLRAYLLGGDRLPRPFRSPEHADALVDRAGGVFLYVFHLSRALGSNAFADVSTLPEGHEFYPAYLARLRERAGPQLFDSVHLPTLLLLCAACQPVTLGQLSRWGIARDRLPFALIDLKDFLRVHRTRRWHDFLADVAAERENRYEIAHDAFLRFVRDDPALGAQLRAANARIGLMAVPERWRDLDPTDDVQLYDLRNVLVHLDAASLNEAAGLFRRDEAYGRACWSAAYAANEKALHLIALDLYDHAEDVYRQLVEREGRAELANDLAAALTNKGNVLQGLGRLAESIGACDAAIAILQRLVEREGRAELANDLAKALANKAMALEQREDWQAALACFEAAIGWNKACVEAGMEHFRSELLSMIRLRMITLLDHRQWDEAATDLVRLLDHSAPALQAGEPSEAVMSELGAVVQILRGLSEEAYDRLEAGLGPWREVVRSRVRGPASGS